MAAAVAAVGWPVPVSWAGHVLGGGGGDFPSIAWGLWRAAEALPGLPALHSELIFYPRGASLMLAALPEAVLLAPLTALLGPVVTFNLLQLLHPALAAAMAFALLRVEGRSAAAAAAGGLTFGLSPVLLSSLHNGNPDVTPLFLIPLAVLLVRRLDTSWLAALGAGLAIGIAPWFNPYVGVMVAAVAAVFAPWRRPARLVVAALIALALAGAYAALVLHSFAVPDAMVHKPGGAADPVPFGVAHLRGFFLPVLEAQADGWSFHAWFLGTTALALGALAIARRRLTGMGRWAAVALIGLTLALGPVLQVDTQTPLSPGGWRIALPAALLQDVPGLSSLKITYRYVALVALALAALAARGVDALPRLRGLAPVLIGAELLLLGGPLIAAGPAPSDDACAMLADLEPGPILDLPSSHDERYLLAQTCHGRPVAEGINQPHPRPVRQAIRKGPRAFDALHSHGFRYLVVHLVPMAQMTAAGERRAMQRIEKLLEYAEEGDRVVARSETVVIVRVGPR